MQKSILLLVICLTGSVLARANNLTRLHFIDQYKDLAISEMHRTGIPASIKLAQAILESNAGQSTLAREANNHFGIKCGSYWKGRTFYRKDDDRNRNGKLIKSCFRAFKNAGQSWIEHSDFLSVQNRRRYDFLFKYSSSDYTNWAYGLKKAGYATDPNYAPRLIQIIEDYQLYQYDNPLDVNPSIAETRIRKDRLTQTPTPAKSNSKKYETPNVFDGGAEGTIAIGAFKEQLVLTKVNGVATMLVDSKMTLHDVADKTEVSAKKLLKYNDDISSWRENLQKGTKVFLAPKKMKYRGSKKFHYVKVEDRMASIADDYGIQLKALYKRNKMNPKTEPAVGERILLKGTLPKGKSIALRTTTPSKEAKFNKTKNRPLAASQKVVNPQLTNTSDIEKSPSAKDNPTSMVNRKPTDNPTPKIHVVQKGETLWAIAQHYKVSISHLKNVNHFTSNVLSIGQKLIIE